MPPDNPQTCVRTCPTPRGKRIYEHLHRFFPTHKTSNGVQRNIPSPGSTLKPQHFQSSPHPQPLGPSSTRIHPPVRVAKVVAGAEKAGAGSRTHASKKKTGDGMIQHQHPPSSTTYTLAFSAAVATACQAGGPGPHIRVECARYDW